MPVLLEEPSKVRAKTREWPVTREEPVTQLVLPRTEKAYDHQVMFATPFEVEGTYDPRENYPFYNALKQRIEGAGQRVFVPHLEIISQMPPEGVYSRIHRAINSSRLVLAHLVPSTNVGVMFQIGANAQKPHVMFYHKSTPRDHEFQAAVGCLQANDALLRQIEYSSDREALDTLEQEVRTFFKK